LFVNGCSTTVVCQRLVSPLVFWLGYGVIRYDHPSTFRTLLKNFANPEFSIARLGAANYTPGMFLKGSSHSSARLFICESVKQWTFCRENMGFV
jgi:hypothetical protein